MNEQLYHTDTAIKALNLYERLILLKNTDDALLADSLEKDRIDRWQQVSALGDEAKFKKRLSQDGIAEWEAYAVLNPENLVWPESEDPAWLAFFDEVSKLAKQLQPIEIFRPEHDKHAFFHIALPFYLHALRQVERFFGHSDEIPLDGACNYLKSLLTGCLANAAALEFNIFKAGRESGLGALLRKATAPENNKSLYRSFIREIYVNRWATFFSEYTVLTRQLCEVAQNWITSMHLFMERYRCDRSGLEQLFNNGQSLGQISKISFGLSDRHNGGKTTAILTFDNAVKIVYKPKPLSTECVLEAIVNWVNLEEELIGLNVASVIDKGDYGWQQFIENNGCDTEEDVKRFYIRAGYLMAIVYVMEGYDFHYENLIADGAFPFLIDTETIFNPYKEMEMAETGVLNAAQMASEKVYYSVLRTGMLPSWNIRKEGAKKDISGLGGEEGAGIEKMQRWVDVGTDDIRLEPVERPVRKMGNQPFIKGEDPGSSENYIDEITKGFSDMYTYIMRNKESFGELIRQWEHVVVRFVRKPTRVYSDMIAKLTEPEFLRDGMDWSIGCESMARLYLAADLGNYGQWNLLRSEYESLIRSDIPYFRLKADSLDIQDGENKTLVKNYFTMRCFERIIEKTKALNENDLALQERYIRYAFYARAAKSFHDDTRSAILNNGSKKRDIGDILAIAPDDCISVAKIIASELEQEALRSSDGSMAWIALEYLKEADIFQFKPISYNLYSGAAGIGFFFGALFKVTGEEKYHLLAKAAMTPIMRIVDEEMNELVRYSGVGGGIGLGSLIYAFASLAVFFQDAEFGKTATDYALKCMTRIDSEVLEADKKLDIIFGSAGLLLGLIKLFRVTGDAEVMHKITMTADHLLKNCRDTAQGEGLVPTYGNKVITGMSHGASGVAIALMKAFDLTKDERYRATAMAHIDFEEKMYDANAANYPTYQSTPTENKFITAWCHGAPGIGLTRLIAYQITHDESLKPQIEKNMQFTTAFSLEHLDHICCGNFGRLDIELEYARFIKDEASIGRIKREAAYIVNRFYENDGFRLFIDAPIKVFSPGLFVGATGIAYSLLRIGFPDQLPSVLAYE
ncbi:type 2 lantipeptide synthetase LanM family protein [Pedobacter sp. MR2016-19]|uniref:type 2 lanthipeptide synthetase LanM family protein n=1 Tax=Pedobacter sp. MR2016-19 TaxID=2780089 RepID=UPI001875FD59|nr:type 2 lanthipeptide synthetase LanM family protein [Pedobacter sp. MR2016-19]MBE5320821.1 type 2 lantipeptide synthetase LanM family protein [Pedobacter sp. MR2016-19]